MIHSVMLMEENRFIENTYNSIHLYAKEFGNKLPDVDILKFCCSGIKALEVCADLKKMGFEIGEPLTMQELFTNQVGKITYFIFPLNGNNHVVEFILE